MSYKTNDIQSLPLKGHGRSFMNCHFISFKEEEVGIKKWIKEIVPKLTSIEEQINTSDYYRRNRTGTSRLFYHLSISKEGFKKLKSTPTTFETAFEEGMKSQSRNILLNDIPVDEWEAPFQKTIDALLIVADNSERNLTMIQHRLQKSLKDIGEIVHVEKGNVLRQHGRSVEHFGYVDGISQPRLVEAGNLNETLLPSILVEEQPDQFGSYLVFRKLEQHVGRFNRKIKRLSNTLGISEELAGAQVIGRFKNGSLLTDNNQAYNLSLIHI